MVTNLPPADLADYQVWLNTIKQRVVSARLRVALAASSELIALYYEIGAQIADREAHARWGSGFIDAFSNDLRQTFPDVGGFSSKNLRYCRAFFRFYCDPAIWQQVVAKLPDTPWAGPYKGKNKNRILFLSKAFLTWFVLCDGRLSRITKSPGFARETFFQTGCFT
jgi:hypothetical protein